MWSGSAKEIVITAIISRTTMKKPTKKQVAPNIMQKQVENTSLSSFILATCMQEPEKQSKNQILNQKLYNASNFAFFVLFKEHDFESKSFQRVRFRNQ